MSEEKKLGAESAAAVAAPRSACSFHSMDEVCANCDGVTPQRVDQSAASESGRTSREAVLLNVIEIVRCHPDFDQGGPMADMMDAAIRGETPKLLTDLEHIKHGVKPPSSVPSAARFRVTMWGADEDGFVSGVLYDEERKEPVTVERSVPSSEAVASKHGLADSWAATKNPAIGDLMASQLRAMAKENGEMFAEVQRMRDESSAAPAERVAELERQLAHARDEWKKYQDLSCQQTGELERLAQSATGGKT